VVIDRDRMKYKSSIRKFTEAYGHAEALIILIISEKYLQSEYCMGEVVQILSNKDYQERIFPVVLPDAGLRDHDRLADYHLYWEERKRRLSNSIGKIEDLSFAGSLVTTLGEITEILRIISKFTTEIGDTITVSPPDYQPLLKALDKRIKKAAKRPSISSPSPTISLHSAFAYRCDRKDQYEKFDGENSLGFLPKTPKVKWYCLYGDHKQAHKSLCERLVRELSWFYSKSDDPDFKPATRWCLKGIRPQLTRNRESNTYKIARELALQFLSEEQIDACGDKLSVASILQSTELKDFGDKDFVFVLVSIIEDDWDKETTPQTIRAVADTFLKAELGPEAPRVYVFFGVEYRKGKKEKRAEMEKELAALPNTLPPLEPVKLKDVIAWFRRYDFLIDKGKGAKKMAKKIYDGKEELDMKEVEIKLRDLLDKQAMAVAQALESS
jgi:inactive STAND